MDVAALWCQGVTVRMLCTRTCTGSNSSTGLQRCNVNVCKHVGTGNALHRCCCNDCMPHSPTDGHDGWQQLAFSFVLLQYCVLEVTALIYGLSGYNFQVNQG